MLTQYALRWMWQDLKMFQRYKKKSKIILSRPISMLTQYVLRWMWHYSVASAPNVALFPLNRHIGHPRTIRWTQSPKSKILARKMLLSQMPSDSAIYLYYSPQNRHIEHHRHMWWPQLNPQGLIFQYYKIMYWTPSHHTLNTVALFSCYPKDKRF